MDQPTKSSSIKSTQALKSKNYGKYTEAELKSFTQIMVRFLTTSPDLLTPKEYLFAVPPTLKYPVKVGDVAYVNSSLGKIPKLSAVVITRILKQPDGEVHSIVQQTSPLSLPLFLQMRQQFTMQKFNALSVKQADRNNLKEFPFFGKDNSLTMRTFKKAPKKVSKKASKHTTNTTKTIKNKSKK